MKRNCLVLCVLLLVLMGQRTSYVKAEGNESKVLELHFDQSTEDTSSNKDAIKIVGNEHYEKGVKGQAFKFDGQTYLDLGTGKELQPQDLTISFWIKTESPLQKEHMLFWFKQDGNFAGEGWYLSCLSAEVPLKLSVGATKDGLPTEAFISEDRNQFFKQDTWYHIAVTYNEKSKEACFYRNGEIFATKYINSKKLSILGTADHKYIGFNSPIYHGSYCKLCMDEVTIYNKTLSKQEVQNVYHEISDPYYKSEKIANVFKCGMLAVGILVIFVIVVWGLRKWYKALLKKVSLEVIEQAKVEEKEEIKKEPEVDTLPLKEELPVEKKTTVTDRVKEYIEQNYSEKSINLNMLGEQFHVTPSYLSKQFKDTNECSPIEYLTSIRIEKAKVELRTTDKTVEQIADDIGYFSSSVFIRTFKKAEEQTPGMYRKQQRLESINSLRNQSS